MSTILRHTGIETGGTRLPAQPIFDYVALTAALGNYKRPRDRITRLLRSGGILRLKKGLYCHAGAIETGALRKELIGNLLYGPSYVSLQTALAIHRLIPEYVHHVTSVTTAKAKRYITPVGAFVYRSVPVSYYWRGVELTGAAPFTAYLRATAEKALADTVYFSTGIESVADAGTFLLADLRIETESLRSLDAALFAEIAQVAGKRSLLRVAELLREVGK